MQLPSSRNRAGELRAGLASSIAAAKQPKSESGALQGMGRTPGAGSRAASSPPPAVSMRSALPASSRAALPSPPFAAHCAPDSAAGGRVKMSCEEIRVFAVKFGQDFDLYFAGNSRLECDYWKEVFPLQHQIFRNVSNQVLVVRLGPENNVMSVFESMTDQEMIAGCGVHFNIHYYRDNRLEDGMSVAFSILVENKTYCMYCTHEGGEKIVRFREEVVPKEILENSSDIIFIQKSISPTDTQAFKFESSLMRGYFLAFQKGEDFSKLILKRCDEDQVDETTHIIIP
ncbi:interleukin-18 isoform X1 [Gopherus flavomarginatus]|uniref:interleukin-18 isoform X1 n=1 Tax=Gopherus flavomarginatus TaxID=286002 RepID=UPI0021CBE149|nr:interleukin-18 isoform X1 [Gopherus flavomarginatus]